MLSQSHNAIVDSLWGIHAGHRCTRRLSQSGSLSCIFHTSTQQTWRTETPRPIESDRCRSQLNQTRSTCEYRKTTSTVSETGLSNNSVNVAVKCPLFDFPTQPSISTAENSSSDEKDGSLAEFSCPACTQRMLPPYRLCVNGHVVCSECIIKITECPSCEQPTGLGE